MGNSVEQGWGWGVVDHKGLGFHEIEQALGDSEGEAWCAAVQGVPKSRAQLSD